MKSEKSARRRQIGVMCAGSTVESERKKNYGGRIYCESFDHPDILFSLFFLFFSITQTFVLLIIEKIIDWFKTDLHLPWLLRNLSGPNLLDLSIEVRITRPRCP